VVTYSRARVLAELGDDYTPSTEQLARVQEYGRAVRSGWGSSAVVIADPVAEQVGALSPS